MAQDGAGGLSQGDGVGVAQGREQVVPGFGHGAGGRGFEAGEAEAAGLAAHPGAGALRHPAVSLGPGVEGVRAPL